jgi:hypothetical protein
MRQKYIISRDGPNSKLIIEEYAIIESTDMVTQEELRVHLYNM